ncbi:hypothetical protein Tco_1087889, partial [Tanacetum coccineum]
VMKLMSLLNEKSGSSANANMAGLEKREGSEDWAGLYLFDSGL